MAMTTATATTEQQELLLKLQSQFGDLDLSNLCQDEQQQAMEHREESEESSLAEPSPDELRAWQQAQFQKGQALLEAQREASKSAVQKRRHDLQTKTDDDDEDDWEQLPSAPNLQGQSSVFFPSCNDRDGTEIVGVHPLLQQLAAADHVLGTAWRRLYSSAHGDGLNFAHFHQKIDGYPGPTVLLIGAVPSASKSLTKKTSARAAAAVTTIGFFTASPWSVSSESSDCFLFAFDDDDEEREEIRFFRPKNPDTKNRQLYLQCHPFSSSTNHHGGGLTIGSSRLHLTERLEECRALDFDTAFEAGDLLLGHAQDALNYFDVCHMELWAVGGQDWIQESLQNQRNHQAIGQANRLRARKVDKQQFLQDLQGGVVNATMKPSGWFAHHGYNMDRCEL